jgi:putative flippase GtrA
MSQTQTKNEWIRSLKFTLFSISAGIIQIVSFTLFLELFQWDEWVCNLISLILSVLWNFTLNRKYTFHSASNVPIAMVKVACFYLVFAPLSSWWTDALTGIGWNAYLVEGLTMLTNFITEYLYDRFFVFRDSIDTAKKQES